MFKEVKKILLLILIASPFVQGQVKFFENFEGDLSNWIIEGEHVIKIIDSKDKSHNKVLELQPDGFVYALIKDSDKWGAIKVEADVFFPDNKHNYFGFVYNFNKTKTRTDLGEIYVKGNGSYLRMNPFREGNASRLLYEEYKTLLTEEDSVIIGKWQKFKAEVKDNICHFYYSDMNIPKVTFDLYEMNSGLIGFKPRIVGYPVLIDNIKITSIKELSYKGRKIPNIQYEPDSLITDWEFIGPFSKPILEIERNGNAEHQEVKIGTETYKWNPFRTDYRGAVITGRVTEYAGSNPVAYFRTKITSEKAKTIILHFSSTDELGLFVNGRYGGVVYRQGYISGPGRPWNAWFDFWENPKHKGRRVKIDLKEGVNQIIIRVRNGQFASGGFFARIE